MELVVAVVVMGQVDRRGISSGSDGHGQVDRLGISSGSDGHGASGRP